MTTILQNSLPDEMTTPTKLPGTGPCGADDWLRVDEAYSAQMAYRAALLAEKGEAVLWYGPGGLAAAQEVLDEALAVLPGLGFAVEDGAVLRPDGQRVALNREDPLRTLGHLVQEDICDLEKRGEEHVLVAAVLCFPANWRLADKAGRPLTEIHVPVDEYDAQLAKRVQRMFDGVRAGRPIWRFNSLAYIDADLHQPFRKTSEGQPRFRRSERQCIVRMPRGQAVVFSIHTYVVPLEEE